MYSPSNEQQTQNQGHSAWPGMKGAGTHRVDNTEDTRKGHGEYDRPEQPCLDVKYEQFRLIVRYLRRIMLFTILEFERYHDRKR